MAMDGGFFGKFTFAPSNQTLHSNTSPVDGRDSFSAANAVDDDDDWGDFVINSGGLAHTLSLPKFSNSIDMFGLSPGHRQKPENVDSSELKQPGSAPGRVNSGPVQWEKPKGALPLSIFGLDEVKEEEEGSGASATSFDDYSKRSNANGYVNKRSDLNLNTNVNDLISNLYNNNNQSHLKNDNTYSNPQGTDLNSKSEVKLNLDWDPLSLNLNKEENSIANEANLGNERFDNVGGGGDDDGWEFKDAQLEVEVSKPNQVKTVNGPESKLNGFSANWNMDFNGWNYNANAVVSSTNSLIKDSVNGNIELDNDDDGWEFKGADLKSQIGDDKGGEVKTEHVPVSNPDGPRSSWDALFSNSSVVNSDEKLFNGNLIDEKKDSDNGDEWAFKGTEPELQVRDGDSKMKTENWPTMNSNWTNAGWNAPSMGGNVNTHLNGLNLDTNQMNLNLFVEHEDLSGDGEWEFKNAETVSTPGDGNTKDGRRMPENVNGALYSFGFGHGVQVPGDLFDASLGTSQKLGELNFEFDFESVGKSKQRTENGLHFSEIDGKVGSDKNSWAFKDAFSEIESKDKEEPRIPESSPVVEVSVYDIKVQDNKGRADNHKGALPLSIFGDEEEETNDSGIYEDISTQFPTSNPRDSIKSPQLDMSINDLISNLYSQVEKNDLVNHAQNLSENGLDSTKSGTTSDLANANHDLDDDSWEFQDAFTGAKPKDQISVPDLGESSTKGGLNDYVQIFSKLKEALQYLTHHHFENLKEALRAAALAGEDAKMHSLDKEIQDLNNELHRDGIFSGEVHLENHSPADASLNVFIEVLQEPMFQAFESEYQLTKKLSLAERDLRSAIELLKYVASTLKILTSLSKEVQSSYVSAWFKMLSVCAQELRHGAFIWKQSLQENVHEEILSQPQGKKYMHALGEIYRVVEVLGCSIKLYKPWILTSSTDPMSIFTLLSECSLLWSSSGLGEALQSILISAGFEDDGTLKTLLESIKYIHNLDADTLFNLVFSGQGPTCQLSALTAGIVPGVKTLLWNGEHCFLTLANLWGNLVSSDPPNLPCVHVG